MRFILKYLLPYRRKMALGLSIKVSATVVELFSPYILSHILKVVALNESIGEIFAWGGIMLLCASLACVGNIIANRMAARVSADFFKRGENGAF